jgi:hypothetical protein
MGKLIAAPDSIKGDIEVVSEDTIFTGGIRLDTIVKPTADTLIIKKKNPADTSDCGREQFY